MKKYEAKLFAAQVGAFMPELDLHKKFPHEVNQELKLFLLENFNQEIEMVRIIYGIGQGKMKQEVLRILENKEVKNFIEKISEEEGSCVVIFK